MFGRLVTSLDTGKACTRTVRHITSAQRCPLHVPTTHTNTQGWGIAQRQCSKLPNSTNCNLRGLTTNSTFLKANIEQPTPQKGQKISASNGSSDSDREIEPSLEVYARPVKDKSEGIVPGKGPPPEIPTTCCASGCANCVWIEYAEELKKYYQDGGDKAKEAIAREVEDANLRAFLMLELS